MNFSLPTLSLEGFAAGKGLKFTFTTHRRDFLTYGDLIFRPGTSVLCSLVYPGDVMVVISENSEGNPFTSLLSEIHFWKREKKAA